VYTEQACQCTICVSYAPAYDVEQPLAASCAYSQDLQDSRKAARAAMRARRARAPRALRAPRVRAAW